MTSAVQLLDKLNVSPPGGLAKALMILKAVLVGVTSFLGAMLLLLAVVYKKQQLAKKAATSRAGENGQFQLDGKPECRCSRHLQESVTDWEQQRVPAVIGLSSCCLQTGADDWALCWMLRIQGLGVARSSRGPSPQLHLVGRS